MRALHVHRLRGIGGSERHLLTLLPALRRRGVDASFLGLDDGEPEPFYEQLAVLDVPYERLRAPRDVDPRLYANVRRVVRSHRPEILHTHLVHADVYGALASLGGRSALISTKHNDDPFRRGPFRHAERLFARRAGRIVCITHALARFNVEHVGLPSAKLVVIHYGLDDLPQPWGPPGGPTLPVDAEVLLAVSRLEQQKGLDVAVEALARIRESRPRAVLVILGEGGLRHELEMLAARRGVGDAVFLAGHTGDVAHWLRRADVFVHPARWEGFGLVLLEAMLAELPIVASRVSSIPEIVVDHATGLLVPPDDPGRLTEAILTLLTDDALRTHYGRAALARAHEQFSVARMVSRTLDVYGEVSGR